MALPQNKIISFTRMHYDPVLSSARRPNLFVILHLEHPSRHRQDARRPELSARQRGRQENLEEALLSTEKVGPLLLYKGHFKGMHATTCLESRGVCISLAECHGIFCNWEEL